MNISIEKLKNIQANALIQYQTATRLLNEAAGGGSPAASPKGLSEEQKQNLIRKRTRTILKKRNHA